MLLFHLSRSRVRVLPPLFLCPFQSSLRRPCLRDFISVHPSLFVVPNLGVVTDDAGGGGGGGGRVRMVVVVWWGGSWFLRAYTAPYLSFLSLWEGEEGPRSRALRTEFIIDRAISLTAPRRS